MNSTPVVIEAATSHTASMIFLHGLGDTGYGWAPALRELSKKFNFMKFILPHAPKRRITLNGGMSMPAWYDIYSLDETDDREDQEGLEASSRTVLKLIEEEEKVGISSERIFVGGFSQGGAVSLFTSLMNPDIKLAGIISLSAYIPCRKLIKSLPVRPRTSPIFMGHGTADMVIQYRWHQHSAAYLKDLEGAALITKSYDGLDHSVCEEEIADVVDFVREQLDKGKDEL